MANRYPGREVAHVWNSQSEEGGSNNNGQFYFTGRAIYSYGSHFLAGYIMPDGVALLNASGYSKTTSKHMSFVYSAACNRRRYQLPDLTKLTDPLRLYVRGRSNARSMRGDVRRYLLEHAAELSDDAGLYVAGLFGLARSWPAIKREAERKAIKTKAESVKRATAAALADAKRFADMTAESFALAIPDGDGRDVVTRQWISGGRAEFIKRLTRAHKAASGAKQTRRKAILWERLKAVRAFDSDPSGAASIKPDAAAIAAERERRRIEAERLEAERRLKWINGDGNGRFSDSAGGALLRIRGEGESAELETSHGARVPLAHAIKAFRFVKLVRERGESWHRNGRTVRVGHYQIDSIDADGFNAGCHRINWPEIERVAKLAGVWTLPADDAAAEPSAHAA